MAPEDPSEIPVRISDADRDRAASLVGEAFAQGRLSPEEHSERIDGVYAARTRADLVPLVRDLPGALAALDAAGVGAQGVGVTVPATGSPAPGAGRPDRIVALFSPVSRTGAWRVPAEVDAVSLFGSAALDLREAVLPGREVRIRATCVFGETMITVPPHMHVVDSGLALFGGREVPPDTPESAGPDAPVLRVTGISLFGLMTVRRRRRAD